MRHLPRLLAITALLGGCASFPQLDAVTSEQAKRAAYPALIPAEGLLARRNQGRLDPTSGEQLLARAARLQARARLIRSIQVVDEATRLRISGRLRALGG